MSATATICTVLVVAIAVYDAVVVYYWGIDASVSRWVQTLGFKSPAVAFAAGWLAAHFFGYMTPKG